MSCLPRPYQILYLVWWFSPDFCESIFTESRDREWDFSRKFLRVENESSGRKIESRKWEFWGKMRVEIENETLDFSRMRVWLKLRVHFCRLLVMESLWLKHKNCNVILKKLPIKSTKINLDFSNFWELDNESWEWEWEFSQQIWESRSRMRREFSLRVSISRSRWESRRSLPLALYWMGSQRQ